MKTKTPISLLLLLLLVVLPTAVQALDYNYTIITPWDPPNSTITITKYTGAGGAVVIPSTIAGFPVTRIGDYAFDSCSTLTSITIPDGVVTIGTRAFLFCNNLLAVTIPNSVTTIGDRAFYGCTKLANVTIPDGVKVILSGLFAYCEALTSVTIPRNVTSIGSNVFANCTSLTSVSILGSPIVWGGYVFQDCTSLAGVYFMGNCPSFANVGDGIFLRASSSAIVYTAPGTTGWGATWNYRPVKLWFSARPGGTRDYPFTVFDAEEGLPKKIGLPEYRINTASLNVALESTLFYMQTLSSPVNLRLVYNSAPTPDGAATIGLFGKNWRFRYEASIMIGALGTEVQVITGGGRALLYTTPAGQDLATASLGSPITLVPPTGVFDELKFYGAGQYFELREKASKVTYRYAVWGGPGNTIWRLTRITDRSNNQINLVVNGTTGRITSITDPAQRVVTLTYSTGENLCSFITVPDGRQISFVYDAHKNLTKITDMAGYVGSYTYDDSGFLLQMTTNAQTNTFTYVERPGSEAGTGVPENAGDMIVASVTNAKGQLTTYELNAAGVKRTDTKGGTIVFTSAAEQTAKVADPLGNISQTEYNSAKLPSSFTDSNGKITTFDYDPRGNLLSTKDALANQTTMTYDSRDNLLSRTNAVGKTWNYAYDLNDRVTSVRTPLENTTQLSYLVNGRIDRIIEARGNSTNSGYDDYGNLEQVIDPLGNFMQFGYSIVGLQCTSLTDQLGRAKTMQYDPNDRLKTLVYDSVGGDPHPQRVNAFDAFGQTSLTDELGQVTSVTRNEFGYLTSITDPLDNVTAMAYDPNNNPVSVTDPLGRITSTTYDAANRPLVVTDALGKTVKRDYDADGNLLTLTDKNENKTVFKYDANNRLIETKDPLLKTVTIGRDALGRAATVTNARGKVVRYSFDDDGRLARKEYQETTDGSFNQKAAFTYDPNGNILSRTDDWGTTSFSYDKRNLPTAMTYPTGKTVTFAYTASGHLSTMTYPNGLSVTYTHDNYNRLPIPVRFYNAAGTELQGDKERPNNVTRLVMALGGTTKTLDFVYDKAGNRLSETRPNNTRTTYEYDQAQKLSKVLHQTGVDTTLLQLDLTYNKVGSVTRELATGSANLAPGIPAADTATYDACNQVTVRNGKAYTYDADGNLIGDGSEFSAAYTLENRPSQITRKRDAVTETIQYTYDANGLRVRRAVVGGATIQFHYGPDSRLLFTTDGAGNVTASYVWNGTVLAAVLTGAALDADLRYVHLDRIGNVMALTDANGAITVKYNYQPSGFAYRETVPAGSVDTNLFTFVGGSGVQDEGGGLFYMKNRYYDAITGRFLQRDPIGATGGMNLYAYAGNNPVNWIDPSGLEGEITLREVVGRQNYGEDSLMAFSGLTGQVEIAMPTSEDSSEWQWKPCKLETKIPIGAMIRASEDSSALISCADMSSFMLKPDSTILINIPPPRSKLGWLATRMWSNIKYTIENGTTERDVWDPRSEDYHIHLFDMGLEGN
jgi:RHS repeat-associated protein